MSALQRMLDAQGGGGAGTAAKTTGARGNASYNASYNTHNAYNARGRSGSGTGAGWGGRRHAAAGGGEGNDRRGGGGSAGGGAGAGERYDRGGRAGRGGGGGFRRVGDDVRAAPPQPRGGSSRWSRNDAGGFGGGRSQHYGGRRKFGGGGGGERDCFGTECQCRSGQSSVYPASRPQDHTVHLHALSRTGRSSLLGHHGQLCGGFYHTAPSTEAGNPRLCLGDDYCAKSPSCILVVRVDERNGGGGEEGGEAGAAASWTGPTFVSRYSNCYRGYEDSVHAEQFMMADPALLAALGGDPSTAAGAPFYRGSPDHQGSGRGGAAAAAANALPAAAPPGVHRRLTMYITQQPCHHSSGRVETQHVSANTSCTNRVLEWKRGALSHLDVELVFKLSRVFRAHWEDDSVHENAEDSACFGSRQKMAKQGLSLLQNEPGISVTMIETEGWEWLSGLCDPYVVNGGVMPGTRVAFEPQMTDAVIAERVQADEFFVNFLAGLKKD